MVTVPKERGSPFRLKIREAFRVLDRDGNGFISKQELGMAMRSLGYMPSEVELAIIMQRLDMDVSLAASQAGKVHQQGAAGNSQLSPDMDKCNGKEDMKQTGPHLLNESKVRTDWLHTTLKLIDGICQGIHGLNIQLIGRLIQEEHVGVLPACGEILRLLQIFPDFMRAWSPLGLYVMILFKELIRAQASGMRFKRLQVSPIYLQLIILSYQHGKQNF
ncbi:hypothetical protein H8959_008327 [Pygathrix nigripes]